MSMCSASADSTATLNSGARTTRWAASRYQALGKRIENLLSDASLDSDSELRALIEKSDGGWVDVTVLLDHVSKTGVEVGSVDATRLCNQLSMSSTSVHVRALQVRRSKKYDARDVTVKRKKQLEEQPVHFPLMSSGELAPMTVSATMPASRLREVFAQYGCVLVTDVLSTSECDQLEQLWRDDLLNTIDESTSKSPYVRAILERVRTDGAQAWPADWKNVLGSKGCASQRSLPHGRFAWAARLHPNVKKVFAGLYDISPEDMAVGLDVVFWAAADSDGPATLNKQWLHVDQNFRSGLTHLCAQGILYVWPSDGDRASTTALWPGSHLTTYERLMQDGHAIGKGKKRYGSQSVQVNNLYSCPLREEIAEQAIAGTRRMPCPRGSLLLWDSRVIHQGWEGGPRLAQPVCWEPKCRRDELALLRKLYCCAAGVPTSHSSSEGRVHGMARAGKPTDSWATSAKPGLKVTVPYCIAPGFEADWNQLQETLWAGRADPSENSWRLTASQGAVIKAILRPEVVHAL
eukprot:TRINITY_DN38205_c0_g1_i1.p1 TRINITY_DN38205_c0_g1~~TRINITY_DN38205_c0_g1_i1.p1  ORF type:complete len:520 (+),score=44.04 TRINITY_DN38205_c0_g1_i1:71-1630(+)